MGHRPPTPAGAPLDDLIATASFPSGHVVRVAVTLGLLAIVFTWRRQSRYRVLALLGLCAFLLIVGIARVAGGEHWPSDVVGGYLLGGAWLAFATAAASLVSERSLGRAEAKDGQLTPEDMG